MAKRKVKVGDLVDITPQALRNAGDTRLGMITKLHDDGNASVYLFKRDYTLFVTQDWVSDFVLKEKK
jgi:hypothetical protein